MILLPSYHIKHKILSSVIAPHGITDLIHATQNNNTRNLLSMNTFCVMTSFGLSQHDVSTIGLNIFFIGSSVIHFRHDFPILFRSNCIEAQRLLFSSVTILIFLINHDLFFYYMCLIHVPKHYYFNREVITKRKIVGVSFILGFTLILSIFGFHQSAYHPLLYPLYKGIIISHVIYQEIYVHNTLKN
jgi:hypothetical protein